MWVTHYQKWKFLPFWSRIPTPGTDWHEILHSQADPRAPRLCQISRESMQEITPCGQKC